MTAALEAEQERTIASLMAEQEDLEEQLKNVSDDDDDDLLLGVDDGSELEESELSVRIIQQKHSSSCIFFVFIFKLDNKNIKLFYVTAW